MAKTSAPKTLEEKTQLQNEVAALAAKGYLTEAQQEKVLMSSKYETYTDFWSSITQPEKKEER